MRHARGRILTVVSAAVFPMLASAQADRYAPTVAQLAPTPRAATLASTAAARDIEAVFGNPAMVGTAAGTVVGMGRFDEATQLTLASSAALGSFSIGIGAQYLDHAAAGNGFPYHSRALQEGGFTPASSAVGAVALATNFRGNRVGAAMKYLEQRIGVLHDAAPSLDVGLARDVARYTIGVTVQNIGSGLHYPTTSAQLPLRVAAGVTTYGFIAGPFDVNGSAGASVLPDGLVLPALGLELAYVPLEGYNFAIRAGVRRPELRAQRPLSIGGSAALDRFALEYAFEDWVNGATHRLALRVR